MRRIPRLGVSPFATHEIWKKELPPLPSNPILFPFVVATAWGVMVRVGIYLEIFLPADLDGIDINRFLL